MGRFDAIKNSINAEIRQNGMKEITGQVMNGVLNGMVDSVDSALTEMEDSLGRDLEGKVDAVEGKGLSSNDYTDAEREKLASLENYDDSGIKEGLKKKQDAIEDLDAIRQGASKGATALQEVPQEYAKKTDVEQGYAKKTDVANGLSGKVDKVAGKGLSTYDFDDSMVKAIERAGNEPIRIRWEDLKDLRDNNELLEGRLYRIADYETTTTQENTQSAGHRFDIIVLALNDHTLAEEAWAIYSMEDSYFADHGANLSAWRIWYCLDNNRERFAWADEDNGKGVIYRMIDEWGNDCPYDFKNIQFKRYILDSSDAFATDVAKGGELDYVKEKLQEMSHRIHTNLWYYGEYVSDVYPDANSEARYVPFGDVDYNMDGPQVLCPINENNYGWFYTFNNEGNDASLLTPNVDEGIGVHDNTIKKSDKAYFVEEGTGSYYPQKTHAQQLNDIVFVGNRCFSNSFGNDCDSNTFGNNCYRNNFGNNCYYNSFGNGCDSNSFGNGCNSNSFGNGCDSNSFGNGCDSNSFGDNCNSNSFGESCYINSFGYNCHSNRFGNACNNISIVDMDTLAHDVSYNIFDNGISCRVYVDGLKSDYGMVRYHHVLGNNYEGRQIEFFMDSGYETTITLNSDGEIKAFVLGDLA